MKKVIILLFGILIISGSVTDVCTADDIFSHKVRPKDISIPEFKNASCKFTQEKYLNNSTNVLKSGGDFQFFAKKGVIFNTLYPVKYTTSYTSGQNKYITDIIISISKKDYSYIEKNFDIYFQKYGSKWELALKPKAKSPAASHLKNIIISGNTGIDQININTLNNGSTKLNFTQCS